MFRGTCMAYACCSSAAASAGCNGATAGPSSAAMRTCAGSQQNQVSCHCQDQNRFGIELDQVEPLESWTKHSAQQHLDSDRVFIEQTKTW